MFFGTSYYVLREHVLLLFKFHFRIEFSDFQVLCVDSLLCESSWAIRLTAASFVAPYWDIVAPHLEFTTIRSSCLFIKISRHFLYKILHVEL
jgi:hypothetical protein